MLTGSSMIANVLALDIIKCLCEHSSSGLAILVWEETKASLMDKINCSALRTKIRFVLLISKLGWAPSKQTLRWKF